MIMDSGIGQRVFAATQRRTRKLKQFRFIFDLLSVEAFGSDFICFATNEVEANRMLERALPGSWRSVKNVIAQEVTIAA